MKLAALVLAAAILTAACASTQRNVRPEVVKAEAGSVSGPQTTCPVMEGKRINKRLFVDYEGFRIYLCCKPCVKAVRKNPEKYLKILQEQGVTPERVKKDAR